MIYASKLAYPGTIVHRKRGTIHLCKLSQKELKKLHDEGCAYIKLSPGDPPYEGPIEVKEVKTVTPKPPKKKGKPIKPSIPTPIPDISEPSEEAPE